MKKINFFIGLLLFITSIVHSQDTIPKHKVEKLLEVMGTSNNFKVVMKNALDSESKRFQSSMEKQLYQEIRERVQEQGYEDILEKVIPIYQKHLTNQEVDAMINFYSSKEGNSIIQKMPSILNESMLAGRQWGEELGNLIVNEFNQSQEEKFDKKITGCKRFKQGKFSYQLPNGTNVLVFREDNMQTESYGETVRVSKIQWVGDCTYHIYELNNDDEIINEEPLIVNIYEHTKNSYKFVAHKEGEGFFSEGELIQN